MTKFLLIFWLSTPSNYTIHDEFISFARCEEKRKFFTEILGKVNSNYVAECRTLQM